MKQDFGKEEEGVGGGTRPERVFLSLLGDLEGSGENEETGEMRKPGERTYMEQVCPGSTMRVSLGI